jgi:protein-S-isoprenylcysteine O-methyltransferase Ste14
MMFLDARIGPLAAVLLFVGAAMILPAVRMRLRTGEWGLAFLSTKDPVQRFVGAILMLSVGAVLAWAILYAFVDPERLGLWRLPIELTIAGWIAMALGFLLIVAAQANMGRSWRIGIDKRTTDLVTSGLYRFVRNPIYSGMIVMLFGFVLATPSSWTALAFSIAFVVLEIQTRLEEKHLIRLHGRAYLEYAGTVGRFAPGIGKLTS